ncbi:MAG: Flp family type IVb pilin [Aggregatibacter segnis]|uniref:Flp family type IVb pilin n=1 Tax=Aggregatibacter segnis TaxID=739 RepID=UPI003FA0B008
MIFFLHKLHNSQRGTTSIEYGLIAVAVAVLLVAILLGDDTFIKVLMSKYSILTGKVSSAVLNKG